MFDKTKAFDLFGKVQNKNTPVYLTLEGFKRSLMKHLGMTDMFWATTNNTNAVYFNVMGTENYPYGYFRLGNFEYLKENANMKSIGRHSSAMTLEEITNATLSKAYMFPVSLSVEMHFITNSIDDLITVIGKVGLISELGKFSFKAYAEGYGEWMVTVVLESPSIAIPSSELEDPSKPAAYDIVFNFKINTKSGVTKQVPKINNAGIVEQNIVAGDVPNA